MDKIGEICKECGQKIEVLCDVCGQKHAEVVVLKGKENKPVCADCQEELEVEGWKELA